MHKYVRLFVGCGIVVLALFGLAQMLGANLEEYVSHLNDQPDWLIALIGATLLLSDVFLPVPSSVVMLALGAHLGVVWGTIAGSLGGLCATLIAFGIGRINKRRVDRWVGEEETMRSHRMLERWGPVAMILSRPLPILAESTAFVAGTTTMRWGTAVWSTAVAIVPVSLLYSCTGAGIAKLTESTMIMGVTFVAASVSWLVLRALEKVVP